ncbi:MAG: hypothetical protein ACXWCO_07810 [Caldimonas sp.]
MRKRLQRRLSHAASARAAVSSPHRLAAWQRRTFYLAGVALLATGAAWLWIHYARPSDALPSAAEPWLMRAHGLGAFVALFVLGGITASHVPRGWRMAQHRGWRRQLGSGLALCGAGAALVLTGYLLSYFAPEDLRPALGWVHGGVGLAMAALVVAHRRGVDGDRGSPPP